MAGSVTPLHGKAGDSEKITINLGYVDLGRVDLLVQEGFYSNRSDFIRTAIRNQLAVQAEVVSQSMVRHTLELGLRDFSRADLEAVRAAGEKLHVKVVGLRAHRCRCPARTRTCDDSIDQRARRAPCQRRGEIGAGRAHLLDHNPH